ncbi:hypothetical protein [Haloechinothrix halophila]|uniref:hypothetical protein n=1 Tax=Haloechinothrix halophila TaxID=1069073 RepID=UPI00042620D8|nr:hypothetical protein [Haloechinothrix halophila]
MSEEKTTPTATRRQVSSARAFADAHGTPVRAVVEPIGRSGARVVLVGKDGALGDVVVPSVETGTALIDAVDDLEKSDWDSDTVGAAAIGPGHRRRMGRSLLRG